MNVNTAIASLLNLPKGCPFNSGVEVIEHAAKNISSFWLDFCSKTIEQEGYILFFTDVADTLVARELERMIYSDIRIYNYNCHSTYTGEQAVTDEIKRLARYEIKIAFESGKYKSVNNRIAEMNEANQIFKAKISSAYSRKG